MVQVLDSTFREGEQCPGVFFERHAKHAIASMLDDAGVGIIEAGHPAASPEAFDSVRHLSGLGLDAKIGAHSRSMQSDVDSAIESGAGFLGIFFCVSEERLSSVFKIQLGEALQRIAESVSYAKQKNPSIIVRFTPEDTVRSQFANVLSASEAALEAGADIISVADTTGFMIPGTEKSMFNYVSRLKSSLAEKGFSPKIEAHCHNDRGFALANAIDAYRAGAEIIDASVLGIGERAGITDLAQLLAVLSVDFGEKFNLKSLPGLYSAVSECSGVKIPEHFPLVGKNSFTHCAGIHTNAARINPAHYESLSPELFGRERTVALGHMSGISSIKWALEKNGIFAPEELLPEILESVKNSGKKGRTVGIEEFRQIVEMQKGKSMLFQEKAALM